MEDTDLIQRLAGEDMTLTVCPLSNQKLCVVTDLRDHPIKTMLDAGLMATVNSDDPSYFGGYVNDNFEAIIQALDLDEGHIRTLAENSFKGSFLTEEDIASHCEQISAVRV